MTSWPAGRWPIILLNAGRSHGQISQTGIWSRIRLPILAIRLPKYGQMAISPAKPQGSGIVNVGTVSEQMLYEIGDPQAYMPDVTCDFSDVAIRQLDDDIVEITNTKAIRPPTAIRSVPHILTGFVPAQ